MEIDKRLDVLENESKLMRGEIKTTITNIRELLATVLLEPLKDEAPPKAAVEQKLPSVSHSDGAPPMPRQMSGSLEDRVIEALVTRDAIMSMDSMKNEKAPPPKDVPRSGTMDGRGLLEKGAVPKPEMMSEPGRKPPDPKKNESFKEPVPKNPVPDNAPDEAEKEVEKAAKKAVEKADQGQESKAIVSEVNPLVNLLRWVATAKRDVGKDQLPVFLEVYTLGGSLSPELRKLILYLASITDEGSAFMHHNKTFGKIFGEQLSSLLEICQASGQLSPEMKQAIIRLADLAEMQAKTDKVEIWSRLILELHGIIDGNENLFIAKKQLQKEEEQKKASTGEGKPVKLKLVLPTGDGEREFGLVFQPEDGLPFEK